VGAPEREHPLVARARGAEPLRYATLPPPESMRRGA
jgi:hypothetical protein